MKRYKYEPEDIVEMQKLRDRGISPDEIARKFGCTVNYVTSHTFKPREVDAGKAMALFRAGWPVSEIAKDLGCAEETVKAIIS